MAYQQGLNAIRNHASIVSAVKQPGVSSVRTHRHRNVSHAAKVQVTEPNVPKALSFPGRVSGGVGGAGKGEHIWVVGEIKKALKEREEANWQKKGGKPQDGDFTRDTKVRNRFVRFSLL